jgi:hypothetical protein
MRAFCSWPCAGVSLPVRECFSAGAVAVISRLCRGAVLVITQIRMASRALLLTNQCLYAMYEPSLCDRYDHSRRASSTSMAWTHGARARARNAGSGLTAKKTTTGFFSVVAVIDHLRTDDPRRLLQLQVRLPPVQVDEIERRSLTKEDGVYRYHLCIPAGFLDGPPAQDP